MNRGYALGTTVDVSRSRAEIDALLCKHGASATAILNDDEKSIAAVAFTMKGARFRIELPLPRPEDAGPERGKEPRGWAYLDPVARERWRTERLTQLRRERWRALLLLIKSKLEIVRLGLFPLEHEFMANLVLPDGAVVHQVLGEAIRRGLGSSDAPRQLGSGEKQ
jgi:hypothetical protein